MFNYMFSFYLSNITVIILLQLIFFLFIYNFYKRFIFKYQIANKNNLIKNNINIVKNILVTYHQEQINFIIKIFNDNTIQQLFFDNIFSNEDKVLLSTINIDFNKQMKEKIKMNKLKEPIELEEQTKLEKPTKLEEPIELKEQEEINELEETNNNIIYPKLPNSPIEN